MNKALTIQRQYYTDLLTGKDTTIESAAQRCNISDLEAIEQAKQSVVIFDGILDELFGKLIVALSKDIELVATKDRVQLLKILSDIRSPAKTEITINNVLADMYKQ